MNNYSSKSRVAVVIPVYKQDLTAQEELSLRQCLTVLGQHPVYVVKPEGLSLSSWERDFPEIRYINFADAYFADIDGYNRLLVSVDFYKQFTRYDYILIYQLDAFVFSDQLAYWCSKGYDYVGAPSLESSAYDALGVNERTIFSEAMVSNRMVLNGGLSLRRVAGILRFLRIHNFLFPRWPGNEDMLFSLDSRRLKPLKFLLNIPSWKEALQFSFEKSPDASFALNENRLPFGCHAWARYDPEFWKKYIADPKA